MEIWTSFQRSQNILYSRRCDTNIDTYYDIKIDPISYPKLKLKKISYVRTHKRTSIHQASIDKGNIIGDLKTDYEELFLEILKKVEEFDNEVIDNALR